MRENSPREDSTGIGRPLGVLALVLALPSGFIRAAEDFKPLVDLRLRSETVDQAGFAQQADALSLRGRLGFQTGKLWDTTLLAEADLMAPLIDRYNSTINGKTGYPVVADPEHYGLDRLQLANTSIPGTLLVVGRQRINLDDQRFVGSVDWRQNEQTFDSARIVNISIPHLTIDLTYLDQVNRVFTSDSPVGRYTGNSYLANIAYVLPVGTISVFDYRLNFEQARTDSSKTAGARLAGRHPVGAVALDYLASYASQSQYAQNPLHYCDDYYIAQLTATYRQVSLGGGLEVLEGDGVKGFSTPLATLHKWNGWADEFLTTPANGLEDRYATLGYLAKRVGMLDSLAATAAFHDYRANRLDVHYGSETDLLLQGKWRRYGALVGFADYAAERFAKNTRKLFVELDYIW